MLWQIILDVVDEGLTEDEALELAREIHANFPQRIADYGVREAD